jgi:hypothetical protein
MLVTKQQLWQYLANVHGKPTQYDAIFDLPREVFDHLQLHHSDIHVIVVDQDMAQDFIGGDDIVRIVDKTLDAQANYRGSHKIITYYGENSEVLIAAVPVHPLPLLIEA